MSNSEMGLIPNDPSEAMTALCRSAMLCQWLLEKCVEKQPNLATEFSDDEICGMRLADDTIRHWKEYLEITS